VRYVRPDISDLSIPGGILEGLENYFQHKIKPGGCLTAILRNDLYMAVSQADPYTHGALKDIIAFLDRVDMPGVRKWGSPSHVDNWLYGGRQ